MQGLNHGFYYIYIYVECFKKKLLTLLLTVRAHFEPKQLDVFETNSNLCVIATIK